MTMKKYRSVLLLLIIAVLVTTLMPVSVASAKTKTKKCTMYQLIKKGKYVYCQNGHHIFKVNIKTEKVTKIIKVGYFVDMKIKGKYLYYYTNSYGLFGSNAYRVKLSNRKKKLLAKDIVFGKFAISGKKIYYQTVVEKGANDYAYKKRVMKLNGKSKKSTKIKGKTKVKSTNASGYYVWNDFDSEYDEWPCKVNYYLHTPGGDIHLDYNWTAN